MKHDREFWARRVKGWRASGMTQQQYCRRHRLLKGTLGYWASTLNKPKAAAVTLVEIGRAKAKPEGSSSPIELVVQRDPPAALNGPKPAAERAFTGPGTPNTEVNALLRRWYCRLTAGD